MHRHAERRVLPYTPTQLFDLVADIERYPEFLPWCVAARIKRRESAHVLFAELVIGFKMVRERYTSRVTLDRPNRVDVTYEEGPFRDLSNHWAFAPDPRGCALHFSVEFEFRSKLLDRIIGPLFEEAVRRMVMAFETRAAKLYGPSAL
jgi:coenzyme Q-binding protein COQ10